MPASPSFPSENRKRKKRERESQINKHHHQKHHRDHEDEEEDNDNNNAAEEDRDDDSDDRPNPQSSANPKLHVEIEALSLDGVQISQFPRAIKRAVNRPHSSVMAIVALESRDRKGQSEHNAPVLENVSHGQLQASSLVPADGGHSSCVIAPPPILEGSGVVKRYGNRVLVVPVHSDWFSLATVHRLERQAVPRFFSGKSPDHTPEKYMECRNHIVARYMEDPGKRITVSNCQELLVGVDSEDLTLIVRFLDHWGVINYCAQGPSHERWDNETCLKETNGAICVPSAALRSIDILIKFDKPKCKLKANEIFSSPTTHNADISDLDDRIREHLSENSCNYCSRPLPVVYYQSQKEVDILLCTDCFHDGRFVTGHSSIDFIRVDSTVDYDDLDGEGWTDQETLLLLEAMEIYNENWNEIAEHVGTKSKSQCILHFLRLSIEDGRLENIKVSNMSLSSNEMNRGNSGRMDCCLNGDSEGHLHHSGNSDGRLPFANSGNPVMALVVFLASAVGPRVAAACAHAALAALAENNSDSLSQIEVEHDNRTNPGTIHRRDGGPQKEIAISNQKNEDKAKIPGSQAQNNNGATPLSAEKVKDAAKAGLSAAAMKAKLFADHEEREIQRLCANIVDTQLKRLDLKLNQFAEIDKLLMKECEQVEKVRQRFAAERSHVISACLGTGGATPPVNATGVRPSMINNSSNNRQQMISGSSSQPGISGYGSSQPVHPHMSFVTPPSMFGLGQRLLPHSMIQQSQSASSNLMFNAPDNVQPTPNHPLLRPVSGTDSGLG